VPERKDAKNTNAEIFIIFLLCVFAVLFASLRSRRAGIRVPRETLRVVGNGCFNLSTCWGAAPPLPLKGQGFRRDDYDELPGEERQAWQTFWGGCSAGTASSSMWMSKLDR
jgi:hypothetical protein